jgi:transportin-1
MGASAAELRALAVSTLNQLANIMPAALMDNMDRFLQGLFTLALDASAAVRKAVCQGLVAMLLAVPERLEPSLPDLIEYMLKSTQDEDESIAVEACEFWTAFCESEVDKDALRPSLPRVLPVLLKNMVSAQVAREAAHLRPRCPQPRSRVGMSPLLPSWAACDLRPHAPARAALLPGVRGV